MPSRPDSSDPRDIADYVDEKLHEMEDRLGTKIAAGFRDQADLYRSGFVDGDPAMHRHAHEIMMKAAEAQRDFWLDMTKKVAQGGVWAAVAGIATALWVWLQIKIGGPK